VGTSTPDPSAGPDEQAYLLFEQLRWNGHPSTCPHCATQGRCYLLRPAGGARRTRTGVRTGRRVWKCGRCRRQFSVLTGTVLQGTRVPLPAWIEAVQLFARAEQPVTASEVGRVTGLGAEAARHVLARWRAALAVEPVAGAGAAAQLFQG
jgi:transposase-like protein